MNTLHDRKARPWVILPSGVFVGDGTSNPFGLNPGQFVDLLVNMESLALSGSLGTGTSANRTLATFINTGSPGIQHKDAFFSVPGHFVDDPILTSGADVTISIFGNPTYLNPADGLFYPTIQFGPTDTSGNAASTVDSGSGVGGTCQFYGITRNLYKLTGSPSFTVVVTKNTSF